jgi:transcriptional regulator with XRE-family HTH domain
MIKKKRIARLSPDFGKRLALVRQMARLSQEAFAKSLGIKSQQAYQHYENGRMPPFNVLVRLAKQYGVSLDYLVMTWGNGDSIRPIRPWNPISRLSAACTGVPFRKSIVSP